MQNYWIQLLFILVISIQLVQLLKCESKIVDRQNDENFKKIYWKCLRNQSGNGHNMETKSNGNVEFIVDTDYYSSDENEKGVRSNRGSNNMHRQNGRGIIRVRRQNQHRGRRNNNLNNNNNNIHSRNNQNNSGTNENESKFNSDCLIQCVFQEIGLVNHNQFPDKNKLVSFILTNVNDLEFRDFVIDSVNECFHYIEYNQVQDKCEFTKNLGDCLTERASINCDHWNNKNKWF